MIAKLWAWVTCQSCGGSGKVNGKTCVACKGKGGANTSTI